MRWPVRPRHHGGSTPAGISADRAATDRGVLHRSPLRLCAAHWRCGTADFDQSRLWVGRDPDGSIVFDPVIVITLRSVGEQGAHLLDVAGVALDVDDRSGSPVLTVADVYTYPPSIRRTRTSDCPATPASTSSRSGATSSHPAHLVHCPAHRCARAPQRVVGRAGCPGVGALNKIVAVVPGPDHGMEPTRGGPGG